jgi:hypothetical protein
MPEGFAGALQKGLLTVRDPQRVGAHYSNAIRVHVAQSLTEALQTSDGPCGDLFVDTAVVLYARCAGRAETAELTQCAAIKL